ncbi:UNVERIFIED_CONTAM: hypothetical protein O8I53_11565 [Campylobacter lari]
MENKFNHDPNNNNLSLISQIEKNIKDVYTEAQNTVKNELENNKNIFTDIDAEKNKFNNTPPKDIKDTITKTNDIIENRIRSFYNQYDNLQFFNQNFGITKRINPQDKTYNFTSVSQLNTYINDQVNKIKNDLKTYVNSNRVILKNNLADQYITNITNNSESLKDLSKLNTLANKIRIDIAKENAKNQIDKLPHLNQTIKSKFKLEIDNLNDLSVISNTGNSNNPVQKAQTLSSAYSLLKLDIDTIPENIKNESVYKLADIEKQNAFNQAYEAAKDLYREKNKYTADEINIISDNLNTAYRNLRESHNETIALIDNKDFNNFSNDKKTAIKNYAKTLDTKNDIVTYIENATTLDTAISNVESSYNDAKRAFDSFNNDPLLKANLTDKLNAAKTILDNANSLINTAKNTHDSVDSNTINEQKNKLTEVSTQLSTGNISNKFSSDKVDLAKNIINSDLTEVDKTNLLNNLIENNDTKDNIQTSLLTKEREIIKNKINQITALSETEKEEYKNKANSANTLDNIKKSLNDALDKAKENIQNIITNSKLANNEKEKLNSDLTNARSNSQPIEELNKVHTLVKQKNKNYYDAKIDELSNLSNTQKQSFKTLIDQKTTINDKERELKNAVDLNNSYKNLNDYLQSNDIHDIKTKNVYKLADPSIQNQFNTKLQNAQDALTDNQKTAAKTANDINNLKSVLSSARSELLASSESTKSEIDRKINELTNLNDNSKTNIKTKAKNANNKADANQIVANSQALNTALGNLNTSITKATNDLNAFKNSGNNNLLPLISDLISTSENVLNQATNLKNQKANNNSGSSLVTDKNAIDGEKTKVDNISTKFSANKLDLAKKIAGSNLIENDKKELLSTLINNSNQETAVQNQLLAKQKQYVKDEIDKLTALSSTEKDAYKNELSSKNNLNDINNVLSTALDKAKQNINTLITTNIDVNQQQTLRSQLDTARNSSSPVSELNNVHSAVLGKTRDYDSIINGLSNLSQNQKDTFKNEIKSKNTKAEKDTVLSNAQSLDNSYGALKTQIETIPQNIKVQTSDDYIYASKAEKEAFNTVLANANNLNTNKTENNNSLVDSVKNALKTAYDNLLKSAKENKALITNASFPNLNTEKVQKIKDHAKKLDSKTEIQNYLSKATELNNLIPSLDLLYNDAKDAYDTFNNDPILKAALNAELTEANTTLTGAVNAINSAKSAKDNVNINNLTQEISHLQAQKQNIENAKIADKFKFDKLIPAKEIVENLPVKSYENQPLREKYLKDLIKPENKTTVKYDEIKNNALTAYKQDIKTQLNNSTYLGTELNKQINSIDRSLTLSDLKRNNERVETKLVSALNNEINNSKLTAEAKNGFRQRVTDANNSKSTSEKGIIKELNDIFKDLINDAKSAVTTILNNKKNKLSDNDYMSLNTALTNADSIAKINKVLEDIKAKLDQKETILEDIQTNEDLDQSQKDKLIKELNEANDTDLPKIKNKLDTIIKINDLTDLTNEQKKQFEDQVIDNNDDELINKNAEILNNAKLQNDKNKAISNINALNNISESQKNKFQEDVNSANDLNESGTDNTPNKKYENAKELDDAYKKLNEKIQSISEDFKNTPEYKLADNDQKMLFDNALKTAKDLYSNKNQDNKSEVAKVEKALKDAYDNLIASSQNNKTLIDNATFNNLSNDKIQSIKDYAKTLGDHDSIASYLRKAKELDDLINTVKTTYDDAKSAFDGFNNNALLKNDLSMELENAGQILNNAANEITDAKTSLNDVTNIKLNEQIQALENAKTNIENHEISNKFNANKLTVASNLANNLPKKTYSDEDLRSKYLKNLVNANPSGDYSNIELQALEENKNNIKNELSKSTYLGNELNNKLDNITNTNRLEDLKNKNNQVENELVAALTTEINRSKLNEDEKTLLIDQVNNLSANKSTSETGIIKELNNVFNDLITKAKNEMSNEIENQKDKLGTNDFNSLKDKLSKANSIDEINQISTEINNKLDQKQTILDRILNNEHLDQDQKDKLTKQVNDVDNNDLDKIDNKLNIIDRINDIENLSNNQKENLENQVISADNNNKANANNILEEATLQSQKNKAINDIEKLTNISDAQKTKFKEAVNSANELNNSNTDNTPKKQYEKAKALDDAYKALTDYVNTLPENYKESQDYKLANEANRTAFDNALNAAKNALNNDQKTDDKTASDINQIYTTLSDAKEALTSSSDNSKNNIREEINKLDQLDQDSKNNIENAALMADTASANTILESAKALNNDIKKLNNEITTANNNITEFKEKGNEKLLALISDKLTDSETKIENAENAKEQATTNIPADSIATHNETVNNHEATLKELNNKFNITKLAEANKIANSNLSDDDKKALLNELINNPDNKSTEELINAVQSKLIEKQKAYVKGEIDKINALTEEEKTAFKSDVDTKTTIEDINNVLENALTKAKNNIDNLVTQSLLPDDEQTALNTATQTAYDNKSIDELNKAYRDVKEKIQTNIENEINTLNYLSETQKSKFINDISSKENVADKRNELQKARDLNSAYESLDTLIKSAEIANVENTSIYKLATPETQQAFENALLNAQNELNDDQKTTTKTADNINNIKKALTDAKYALKSSSDTFKTKIDDLYNELNSDFDQNSKDNIKNKALNAENAADADKIIEDAKALNNAINDLNKKITETETNLNKFKNSDNDKLLPLIKDLLDDAKNKLDAAKNNKTLVTNNNLANKLVADKDLISNNTTELTTVNAKFNDDKLETAKKIADSNLSDKDKKDLLNDLINNNANKENDVLIKDIQDALISKEKEYAENKVNNLDALSKAEKDELINQINEKNTKEDIDKVINSALDKAKEKINNIIDNSLLSETEKDTFNDEAKDAREKTSISDLNKVYNDVKEEMNNKADKELAKLDNLSKAQKDKIKEDLTSETNTKADKLEVLNNAKELDKAYKDLDSLTKSDEISKIKDTNAYKLASDEDKANFDQKLKEAQDTLVENAKTTDKNAQSINEIKKALENAKNNLITSSENQKAKIDTKINKLNNLDAKSKENIINEAKNSNSQAEANEIITNAQNLDKAISELNQKIETAKNNIDAFKNSNDVKLTKLIKDLLTDADNRIDSAKSNSESIANNNSGNDLINNTNTIKENINNIDELINQFNTNKLEIAKNIANSKLKEKDKKELIDKLIKNNEDVQKEFENLKNNHLKQRNIKIILLTSLFLVP